MGLLSGNSRGPACDAHARGVSSRAGLTEKVAPPEPFNTPIDVTSTEGEETFKLTLCANSVGESRPDAPSSTRGDQLPRAAPMAQ